MGCEHIQALIEKQLDEVLSQEEMSLIETHIQDCSTCREEYIIFSQMKSAFEATPTLDVPSGFHESLMQRISEEVQIGTETTDQVDMKSEDNVIPMTRNKKKRYFKPYINVAAAAVIIVLFAVIGRNTPEIFKYDAADETMSVTTTTESTTETTMTESASYEAQDASSDISDYVGSAEMADQEQTVTMTMDTAYEDTTESTAEEAAGTMSVEMEMASVEVSDEPTAVNEATSTDVSFSESVVSENSETSGSEQPKALITDGASGEKDVTRQVTLSMAQGKAAHAASAPIPLIWKLLFAGWAFILAIMSIRILKRS